MKKRRDAVRRSKHGPQRSRPKTTRHIVPPPLIGPDTCHTFHPDLTGRFVHRDGTGDFPFQTALSLAEVVEMAPAKLVLTRHKKATIVGLWWVPEDHRGPVPHFIFDQIFNAINHGSAFLVLGDSERAVQRVVIAIARVLDPSAGSA
jgi:hypothetical protein